MENSWELKRKLHLESLTEACVDACVDKFFYLHTEVPSGLFWDIFNDIRNKVNRANGKMNTFVGFNKCIYVLVKNAAKTFAVFSGDNN